MIEATTTVIKNNSITLPKTWTGARVLVRINANTATITKIEPPKVPIRNMVKQFREAAKRTKLTPVEVNRAIKAVRKPAIA